MKIEIGESLTCSWLRHVRQCWLVQANWKVSEHWEQYPTDAELEELFRGMKSRFDHGGGVFGRTKDARQFLKQGEIDVVGVDREGSVHAADVAFHEAGLQYGTPMETSHKVLMKMLRTLLILRTFRPLETRLQVYFLSPKVSPRVHRPLEDTFAALRREYDDVEWRLIANEEFTEDVVTPTLKRASAVADSSELFMRSAKLLELAGCSPRPRPGVQRVRSDGKQPSAVPPKFQTLVQDLMQTLLEEAPDLLSDDDKDGLQDKNYCKNIGFNISNLPLLREAALGTSVSGHPRYWQHAYGGFRVCKEWRLKDALSNARAMLDFVKDVAVRNAAQAEAKELRRHESALRAYIGAA